MNLTLIRCHKLTQYMSTFGKFSHETCYKNISNLAFIDSKFRDYMLANGNK